MLGHGCQAEPWEKAGSKLLWTLRMRTAAVRIHDDGNRSASGQRLNAGGREISSLVSAGSCYGTWEFLRQLKQATVDVQSSRGIRRRFAGN